MFETLELLLTFNKFIFINKNYLQSDGTAQTPYMYCSYADLAIELIKSLNKTVAITCNSIT